MHVLMIQQSIVLLKLYRWTTSRKWLECKLMAVSQDHDISDGMATKQF